MRGHYKGKTAELWKGMADFAENKANKAANEEKPWSHANLRMWQNKMSEWYGNQLKAEKLGQRRES